MYEHISVNVTHGIKPIEVEGKIYALKKGDSAFIPSKLAGAMIKRGWAAEIAPTEKDDLDKDNSAVEEAIEKEAVKLREEIVAEEQAGKNDWTIIKEGRVNNVQSWGYGRSVRLEQSGSFYRVVVEKGKEERERAIMIGFATDEEAVERYEWYVEVR